MKAGEHGIGAPAARAAVLAVAPGLPFVIKPVMSLRAGAETGVAGLDLSLHGEVVHD